MDWKPLEVPIVTNKQDVLRLLDWVRGQGPEEWHGIVSSMNWGTGLEHVVDWICAQPDCHKATALWAFWIGAMPGDWIDLPFPAQSLSYVMQDPARYHLGMNILSYWHRGTYKDNIALTKTQRQDIASARKFYEKRVAELPVGMVPPLQLPERFESRGAEIEVDMHYFAEGWPAPMSGLFANPRLSEVARSAPNLTYREFKRLHTIELETAALRQRH
jgi:hypothetical protein